MGIEKFVELRSRDNFLRSLRRDAFSRLWLKGSIIAVCAKTTRITGSIQDWRSSRQGHALAHMLSVVTKFHVCLVLRAHLLLGEKRVLQASLVILASIIVSQSFVSNSR